MEGVVSAPVPDRDSGDRSSVSPGKGAGSGVDATEWRDGGESRWERESEREEGMRKGRREGREER